MESNKPYNKINSNESWTDGVLDGAIYGVGAGAATMGAIHGGMAAYGSQSRASRLADRSTAINAVLANAEEGTKKHAKLSKQSQRIDNKIDKQNAFNSKKGLSGWRGLGAYGGSALLGGVAGGIIDNFNN